MRYAQDVAGGAIATCARWTRARATAPSEGRSPVIPLHSTTPRNSQLDTVRKLQLRYAALPFIPNSFGDGRSWTPLSNCLTNSC